MQSIGKFVHSGLSGRKKRLDAGLRMLLAVTLVAGLGLAVSAGSQDREVLAVPPESTVSGTVFQDFNSDGVMDTTVMSGQATDIGIAGVTVHAYNAAGELVGTAVSDADGEYVIDVEAEEGEPLRLEFILPTEGPLASLRPAFEGSNNGTTVQFVAAGDENIDLGLNVPGEYCQANPRLAVSRLCAGINFSPGAPPNNPSVFVTNYDGGPYSSANGFSDVYTNWSSVTAAQATTTGTILGMAWDPNSGRVYNTAYVRRHAEMYEADGRARPGALFVTTPSASGVGGSTAFLVDLEDLLPGDQFSNSTPGQEGFIPLNAARQLECIEHKTAAQSADPCYQKGADSDIAPAGQVGVFEEVGQTGIGEIEVDDEGNLYVVSLYDKNLYKVTMPADGTAPITMVSLGDITAGVNCINGEGRPFAVTNWRGSLYLGMTCDGSGDFPADIANYSPTTTLDQNISFTIRRYDLGTGSWSTHFGPQSLSGIQRGSADGTSSNWQETSRRWNPWTNEYSDKTVAGAEVFGVRPVPMLSDIAFDNDGSMILGVRDRTGDQLATNGSETPIGTETNYPAITSGDIYRVCRTGPGYTAADYTFEGGTGCDQNVSTANGTEYYFGDKYFNFHFEVGVGMLEQVPGFPDVIMTAYDPYDGDGTGATFYSGGIRYLRNATGDVAKNDGTGFPNAGSGVIFFAWEFPGGNVNKAGGFLKTNGMSDIEALCDQAPVQIGNRVWIDTNKNGIQDPDEEPVEGVTLRLYTADGQTLLGTAVTNEFGEYYFSSNIVEDPEGDGEGGVDHQGGGLVIGQDHIVRLDEPSDFEEGGPLYGYVLTTQFAEQDEEARTAVDSNAEIVDEYPEIFVDSRSAGENDHTFDVGFFLFPRVSVGDYVWWDTNGDGVQDDTDVPLEGVVLRILTADGDPVIDVYGAPVEPTETDVDGYYTFDDLPPGQYRVEVTAPPGFMPTRAAVGDPATDSSTRFALSRLLTDHGDRDPTLDFGFVPVPLGSPIESSVIKVSVGDYVWWDTNEDGRQDETDIPLEGVALRLLTINGDAVVDVFGNPVNYTFTNASGYYSFDNLPPGQYRVEIETPDGFVPTLANVGSADADSSTDMAESRVLTMDGERDPTLDFGFVPAQAQTTSQLPTTGAAILTYLLVSLLLIIAGGAFWLRGRWLPGLLKN
jgi:hypothetical protein